MRTPQQSCPLVAEADLFRAIEVSSRRRAVLLSLASALAVSIGCSDATQPIRPPDGKLPPAEAPKAPDVPTSAPPAPTFPSLTHSGRIYAPLNDPYLPYASFHGGSIGSRYVLYADSSFG